MALVRSATRRSVVALTDTSRHRGAGSVPTLLAAENRRDPYENLESCRTTLGQPEVLTPSAGKATWCRCLSKSVRHDPRREGHMVDSVAVGDASS